ncbi:vanadium-dependent haloperoxidase [Ideonella sp. A 288]|uniref:vanadium-dependent haloperoxidase n=1 Tax=Ideonella sp. A 288 TaxID=1962181 RepID=UPI001184BEB2|nr:vanadium-dependent haloperoxidase [Ideonella sp. A 288]
MAPRSPFLHAASAVTLWLSMPGAPALAAPLPDAPTTVAVWNQAALDEVRASRMGPPVVARALAIAHTCMYDAWVPYDARAAGAVATLPRRPLAERTEANKAKAIGHAAHRCLLNLFPAGAARLAAVMRAQGHDPADASLQVSTPQGIGNAAAAAVIASRRHDGSNQYGDLGTGPYADTTGYAPVNAPMPFCLPTTPGPCPLNVSDPFRWQPLVNDVGAVQTFIAPHWGLVRPFALSSGNVYDQRPDIAPVPNYLQSPARLQADIDEMLRLSARLTPHQKLIVEYWADGPDSELPPGHWGLFAQHVSRRDRHTIDDDVKMFFAMHNASFDAGIVAWHLKRKHEGVRPITLVRHFRRGTLEFAWGGPGRPQQLIDAGKWTPYNPGSNLSPAFPGYISGHSTFSSASAEVLRAFTGSDHFGFSVLVPRNFGRVEPGVPAVDTVLTYPTFSAAADEAGQSRLFAGIHSSDDNTIGQAVGRLVAQQVLAKARALFDGGLAAGASSRASTPEARSLSWHHTVGPSSDRLLVVGVATTTKDNPVRSVAYGTAALARLASQNGPGGDNRVELWVLVDPPVGTATVQVQMTARDDLVAGATNFSGVHQTTPFGTLRAAAGTGRAACLTLANAPAPLVATVLAANSDAGGVMPGAGQALDWAAVSKPGGSEPSSDVIGAGFSGPGGPVATVCQTLAKARPWSMLAVPLLPAQ